MGDVGTTACSSLACWVTEDESDHTVLDISWPDRAQGNSGGVSGVVSVMCQGQALLPASHDCGGDVCMAVEGPTG